MQETVNLTPDGSPKLVGECRTKRALSESSIRFHLNQPSGDWVMGRGQEKVGEAPTLSLFPSISPTSETRLPKRNRASQSISRPARAPQMKLRWRQPQHWPDCSSSSSPNPGAPRPRTPFGTRVRPSHPTRPRHPVLGPG